MGKMENYDPYEGYVEVPFNEARRLPSFKPELLTKVLRGEKTQTRRLKTYPYEVGDYAVVSEPLINVGGLVGYKTTVDGIYNVIREHGGGGVYLLSDEPWPTHWKKDQQSSMLMPIRLGRCVVRITRNERAPLFDSWRLEDAAREGFATTEEFFEKWNLINPGAEIYTNPMVTILEWEFLGVWHRFHDWWLVLDLKNGSPAQGSYFAEASADKGVVDHDE